MTKKPKWRVHISKTSNYFVDVDDDGGVDSAIEKAYQEVLKDPTYHQVNKYYIVNSVFINDYDTKYYYPFIPESLPPKE